MTDGVFAAVRDPKRPRPIPSLEEVPPALNFAPLENAASALTRAADRYHKAVAAARQRVVTDTAAASGDQCPADPERAAVHRRAGVAAPQLVPASPLRARYCTGYGVKTMPGVREAIEDKRYGEVEREVLRVAAALTRETTLLEGMAADLERLIR